MHLTILSGTLAQSRWLVDRLPAPPLSADAPVTGALYIDNLAAFSLDAAAAEETRDSMRYALAAQGIVAYDDVVDESPSFIGFELYQGNTWRPTRRKFWKTVLALRWLIDERPLVAGWEIERLVGHLIHLLGIRRPLLSLLVYSYAFISSSYTRRQPIWPSLRQELHSIHALLPLAVARIDLDWSPTVHCFDASLWGFGVARTTVGSQIAEDVGRWNERARFRGALAVTDHRERALASKSSCLGSESHVTSFSDVPLIF